MLPSYFIYERKLKMAMKEARYRRWAEIINKCQSLRNEIQEYRYTCGSISYEYAYQLKEYVQELDNLIEEYERIKNSVLIRMFFRCNADFLLELDYKRLYIEQFYYILKTKIDIEKAQKDFRKHNHNTNSYSQRTTTSNNYNNKISAYGVLGIKPGATVMEVKRAYRTTVKRVHPDNGGSQKEFILAQRAYEFIMNRIQ